ncbi:MAG: hypothetical protein ACU843_10085 [Gammaproteobacteria bacterium]
MEPLPDPIALVPNWSRYLEVDPEIRRQRTKLVIARVRERFAELPADSKLRAESKVKRAIDRFSAYAESPSSPSPQASLRPPFAESYSLFEWLEITRKLRYAQSEIEADRDSIQRCCPSM